MKVSPLELDSEGDVELVLGFEDSTSLYNSELAWLKPERIVPQFDEPESPYDPEAEQPKSEPKISRKQKKKKKKKKGFADVPLPKPPLEPWSIEAPLAEALQEPQPVEAPFLPADALPEAEDSALPKAEEVAEEPIPVVVGEAYPEVEDAVLEPEKVVEEPIPVEVGETYPEVEDAVLEAEEAAPEVEEVLWKTEKELIEPEPLHQAEVPFESDIVLEPRTSPNLSATVDPEIAQSAVDDLNPDIPPPSDESVTEPAIAVVDDEEYQLRLIVSSRHLRLASPVFKELLGEPIQANNGHILRRIRLIGWDPEALLIVMDIIHGHHRDVPRSVSLETLVDIALIVDYYRLHEITEVFGEIWLRNLPKDLPTAHEKESIVFLFLAWVFSDQELFRSMTKLAILNCKGPINTMLLPIPDVILEDILEERGQLMSGLFDIPYKALERLLLDREFERSGLWLGCLVKSMHSNGLPISKPDNYDWNCSVLTLKETILGFRPPAVMQFGRINGYGIAKGYEFESPIEAVLQELYGLDLRNYTSSYEKLKIETVSVGESINMG